MSDPNEPTPQADPAVEHGPVEHGPVEHGPVEHGDREQQDSDRTAPGAPVAVRVDPAAPTPPPATPGEPQPIPPATEPAAPRRRSNRLVATAWVLLAAGLFEALYLASLLLYVLVEGGAVAVGSSALPILRSPFAWAPVLIFAVLFELTVLALNRAGRFASVVTSLVVGLLVYFFSIAVVLLIQQGGIGDPSVVGRVLIAPQFVLAGLLAREVMLWTGFAVGARGRRSRLRNRDDREGHDRGVAATDAAGS